MLLSAVLLFVANPIAAHEFWISPVEYVIVADRPVKAQLRIGSNFEGAVQRFFTAQFTRFEVFQNGNVVTVSGRLGDDPALNIAALGDGLLIVVHETTSSVLTYRKPETFADFATHKGAPDLIVQNQKRGFPVMGFRESFRRFAKSLIAVGTGEGQDVRIGLRAEIVALANPYIDDLVSGFPVQVFYQGQPRPQAFVEVFARNRDGEVTSKAYRADDTGIARLDVAPDVEYLVDATLILPLPNEDITLGPVWESLWASLTFKVPDR
ncbi:MAG: putative GH25 family protein [Paracoccaceae bacterium]|jgi:uncharacterized GH25 family protein